MLIDTLSPKQKQVFRFFGSEYDMLFADGSVRSGKTFSLLIAYLLWASSFGKGHDFGIAGCTIGALKRNIINPYIVPLQEDPDFIRLGGIKFNWGENRFAFAGSNFYWFGGDNEKSQSLIQGKTLAGMLFDESVTMLRSFVDQAMARCSVDGAKMVFSCNPANPNHYFKTDFIDRASDLNALYLHWTMDDNPSLTEKVKERYQRMYTGVFYERYILGKWVAAEGTIFLQFAANPARWIIPKPLEGYAGLAIGVDFGGSKSKTVFILIGIIDTATGPQLHILKSHRVKDHGFGVDSEQIKREYAEFFRAVVAEFNMIPHVTNTDHMDMLRLDLKKAVADYEHPVRFVDKATVTLSEWVKLLNALFNLDMIRIVEGNDVVVECFKGLLYDEDADDDRPLDDGVSCDVDTYDATRYASVDVVKDWVRRKIIGEAA